MPQADNNITQAQPKRYGIVAEPKDLAGTKVIDITLISNEAVSKTLAEWTSKSGSHPFTIGNSNKTVNFRIRQGDENVFVQKNMYRAIEAAMKYNGFEMTSQDFLGALNRALADHDYPTKEERLSVDVSFDAMMNSIFDNFEKKLDDPAVQQLLNTMQLYDPIKGDFKNAAQLLKDGRMSARNVIYALGQWRNSGKSGIPTFVATAKQWQGYNRYVTNFATRLFLNTPNLSKKMSKREVAQTYNISPDQINNNAHIYHAADTHYIHHGESVNAENGFHLEVFYDVSDTEVIPGMPDLFNEDAGLESNLWRDDRWNKKALESGMFGEPSEENKQAIANAGFTNDEANEQTIKNGLSVWCEQNPVVGKDVKNMLDNNNLVGAVRKYFETHAFFETHRENTPMKNALLNICVFSVLNYYGVAPADMLMAYQQSRNYLIKNKRMDKGAKIALMPFFSNFIKMINNNNAQVATNECKEVESKFRNLWNRMVEAEEKNRNAKVF